LRTFFERKTEVCRFRGGFFSPKRFDINDHNADIAQLVSDAPMSQDETVWVERCCCFEKRKMPM
jgi:hypothetical protein